jgi:DNA adenine methylase
MGSKRRLWKYISPIILKDRKPNQFYVEPFCGGCNSLSQVNGKRIAADINIYLIEMRKSLIKEEKQIYPITKEIYNNVRNCYRCKNGKYSFSDIGWIGFMASYNGRFFDGGFSGNNVMGKNGGLRHYIDECMSDILQQLETLKDVDFRCCSYDDLQIPKKSIIYCDPPYNGTKRYDTIDFDYDKFYNWCFEQSKLGNKVFISEYSMPESFKEVWSMEVRCNINIEKNKRVEKLFTI